MVFLFLVFPTKVTKDGSKSDGITVTIYKVGTTRVICYHALAARFDHREETKQVIRLGRSAPYYL